MSLAPNQTLYVHNLSLKLAKTGERQPLRATRPPFPLII